VSSEPQPVNKINVIDASELEGVDYERVLMRLVGPMLVRDSADNKHYIDIGAGLLSTRALRVLADKLDAMSTPEAPTSE
jgi:hypothetical protein